MNLNNCNKKKNSTRKLTPEIVLSKIREKLSNDNYEFTLFNYKNIRTNIILTCKKHGNFLISPNSAMSGKGCKLCDKFKNNKSIQLSLEEYKTFASELHNFKYDYSLVTNLTNKITIICKDHGQFTTRTSAHISPSQLYGCRRCNQIMSRGENKIHNFLNKHNIKFISEWSIEGVTGTNNTQPLKYDFYLPNKNLIIEYDGPHHFGPIKYGGQTQEKANKQFEKIKVYDEIKNANAIVAGISLLRIDHKLFVKLDEILYNNIIENLPIKQTRIIKCDHLDIDQLKPMVIILDYQQHLGNGEQ